MIDPNNCVLSIKLLKDKKVMKCLVTFRQDDCRFSGFVIKDGPHGLYLDPPRIAPGFKEVYFDENKERWKELQIKAIEVYEEELKKENDVEEFDMKIMDEVWEGEKPNSN